MTGFADDCSSTYPANIGDFDQPSVLSRPRCRLYVHILEIFT